MDDDQLMVLAEKFVEIKVPFADSSYKKELAGELRSKMEEIINLELLSNMTPEQTEDYQVLLESDNTTDDAIISYIKKCDIDIDNLTAAALTKFRVAYLGA